MRKGDLAGVVDVYGERVRAAAGPMHRSPAYWRRRTRKKRGWPWVVAEERGRIEGYAWALVENGIAYVRDVLWRPEHDGTDLGDRLLREVLRRVDRLRPCMVTAVEMSGSPALPALRRALRHEEPPLSLFMAAPLDPRDLLRDAARVLRSRTHANLRLRSGGREASTGDGASVATLAMEPEVLLGLLLGIRTLEKELRTGGVRVTPGTRRGLEAARAAFPHRAFWIVDHW